jgi:gamma-glutamylcyclotransferase (GGCT)/AIG2-like uncharacterized protein YtfP
MKGKKYLFVYGSMKKGFSNHKRLIGSEFMGAGKTVTRYAMHPALFYLFPYLIEFNDGVCDNFNRINGEVYLVDLTAIETVIDTLEGAPNYYYRKEIEVELEDGKIVLAEVYFVNMENEDNEMDTNFFIDEWSVSHEEKGLRLAGFLGRF